MKWEGDDSKFFQNIGILLQQCSVTTQKTLTCTLYELMQTPKASTNIKKSHVY